MCTFVSATAQSYRTLPVREVAKLSRSESTIHTATIRVRDARMEQQLFAYCVQATIAQWHACKLTIYVTGQTLFGRKSLQCLPAQPYRIYAVTVPSHPRSKLLNTCMMRQHFSSRIRAVSGPTSSTLCTTPDPLRTLCGLLATMIHDGLENQNCTMLDSLLLHYPTTHQGQHILPRRPASANQISELNDEPHNENMQHYHLSISCRMPGIFGLFRFDEINLLLNVGGALTFAC